MTAFHDGDLRTSRWNIFARRPTRGERSDEFSEPDRRIFGAFYGRRIGVCLFQSADRLAGPSEAPNAEKLEVYECGEPTIGSSFVQFDLRFYVVALLLIIFDVEVVFLFPWATVYGKAIHLLDPRVAVMASSDPGYAPKAIDAEPPRRPGGPRSERGGSRAVPRTGSTGGAMPTSQKELVDTAQTLAVASIFDIGSSSPCCWSALPMCGDGAISTGCGHSAASGRPWSRCAGQIWEEPTPVARKVHADTRRHAALRP